MDTGTRSKHSFTIEHILAKPDKLQPEGREFDRRPQIGSAFDAVVTVVQPQHQHPSSLQDDGRSLSPTAFHHHHHQHHHHLSPGMEPLLYHHHHQHGFTAAAPSIGNEMDDTFANESPRVVPNVGGGGRCSTPDDLALDMDMQDTDASSRGGCISDEADDGASEEGGCECDIYYFLGFSRVDRVRFRASKVTVSD